MAALMRITKTASTEPATPPATALLSPAATAMQKTDILPTNQQTLLSTHATPGL